MRESIHRIYSASTGWKTVVRLMECYVANRYVMMNGLFLQMVITEKRKLKLNEYMNIDKNLTKIRSNLQRYFLRCNISAT